MKLTKFLQALSNPLLLYYYLQRRVRGHRKRDILARGIGRVIGRRRFPGESIVPAGDVKALAGRLRNEGYVRLGKVFSADEVAGIRRALEGRRCYDAYDRVSEESFLLENAAPSCHAAYYYWQDFIDIAPLVRIANDPALLTIVQEFLGGTPTLSDMKMWWSLIREEGGKENQLFHRDIDDSKFCKLFVYLTDVGPEGGPHVYVPRSAATSDFLQDRRYTDTEVDQRFGGRVETFIGDAGSAFLVNTYGLHKGLAPSKSRRLIFVAQYSLLPIGLIEYSPAAVSRPAYRNLDRYVNRLFLRVRKN